MGPHWGGVVRVLVYLDVSLSVFSCLAAAAGEHCCIGIAVIAANCAEAQHLCRTSIGCCCRLLRKTVRNDAPAVRAGLLSVWSGGPHTSWLPMTTASSARRRSAGFMMEASSIRWQQSWSRRRLHAAQPAKPSGTRPKVSGNTQNKSLWLSSSEFAQQSFNDPQSGQLATTGNEWYLQPTAVWVVGYLATAFTWQWFAIGTCTACCCLSAHTLQCRPQACHQLFMYAIILSTLHI